MEAKTRTARVVVRHGARCSCRRKGPEWRRCRCRKSLAIYESGAGSRYISAGTRSWEQAEKFRQQWLDARDPEKAELRRLRGERERQEKRIEEAVSLYITDLVTRLGDNGTVAMARSLLGRIDGNGAVERDGHFFRWLGKQNPRPVFIGDIAPEHLVKWRASWKFGDQTARQRWGIVKAFFNFCVGQDWIAQSPARSIKPPKIDRGNRTGIFTDGQYDAILDATSRYEPSENVPEMTRKNWRRRLLAFVELLRWSGMNLGDAVQFRAPMVDDEGVLRYARQKNGQAAVVLLPPHVAALLRNIPPENGSHRSYPFAVIGTNTKSDTRRWEHRLETLFDLAGVKTVTLANGKSRKPHARDLRHTFAVWNLRHGASVHTVARMLGHSTTRETERTYLPWVRELEQATIADARRALAKMPKPRIGRVVPIFQG